MSDNIKELVNRLRDIDHMSVTDCFLQSPYFRKAADALEAMASEVERLKASLNDAQGRAHARALLEDAGIDADGCLAEVARDFARKAIAAERDRDRLKAALEVPVVWSMEERDGLADVWREASRKHGHYETLFAIAAWLLRNRARKALGGDAS